jgi:hypothetical protein
MNLCTKIILVSISLLNLHADLPLDKYSAFYLTSPGKNIMNPTTYTDGIHRFLKAEEAFILNAMPNYDILLEIGCARAERAEVIARLGRGFYGIDINHDYLMHASKSFIENGISECATVSLFSVNNLNASTFPINRNKKTLIFFPFNLLGNLQDFHLILENMIDIGQDFCFSTYKLTDQTKKSRLNYYENCGCQQVRYSRTSIGDLFDSVDGLHSAAFSVSYIIDILVNTLESRGKTAIVTISDLEHLGHLIYIKRIKSY